MNFCQQIYGRGHEEVAIVLSNLAALHLKMNNLPEALALSRESLDLHVRNLGPQHILVASTQVTFGGAMYKAQQA